MTEQNFDQMRRAMVASQLRTTGVNDPRVLAAMGAVPRERFIPADRSAAAYSDALVPIGEGRWLNSPMALGRLLTEAAPRAGDRALVVGAATGYAAAVLAELVGTVVALEEDEALAGRAKAALTGSAIQLVTGPLAGGWKRGAPYDLIVIDGAVETIPDALVDQLADGGRLAAAVVENGVQRLAIGRKAGEGFGMIAFADVASAPLPGFAPAPAFSF
jgi:protein-L-isoaspartate(D-aspartate) O-methyltransferase